MKSNEEIAGLFVFPCVMTSIALKENLSSKESFVKNIG